VPQLSVLLLLICDAASVPVPDAFKVTVAFLHKAAGAILSETFTVPEQVAVLPDASLTVSTTVLLPILAQVNVLGKTDRLTVLQLSLLPLFNADAFSAAVPVLLSNSAMGAVWHTAVGAELSNMLIAAVQVAVLPLWSVTVRVTVLAPAPEQLKVVWLRL